MKAVAYKSCGDAHDLQVKEAPRPLVGPEEIMIEVAATGLNSYDIFWRKGVLFPQYTPYTYLGFECSGVVVAVSSGVSEFKKGDNVCAILTCGGGYAEFVSVHKSLVLRIPGSISIYEAAALPQASCLSLYALSVLTNATRGKRILIHGAAGGVGIIALQYAKHVGCEVFAVAGTEEKLQLCKLLGANVCINYKKEDFCERVKTETGGKGVDIILDVNGRDNFLKNVDCLAIGGSIVNLGVKTGRLVNIKFSLLAAKDVCVVAGSLLGLSYKRLAWLLSEVAATLWPLIEAGCVKPIIGKVYSFSQAEEAHRALQEYPFAGKLLLVPKETKQNDEYGAAITYTSSFCT